MFQFREQKNLLGGLETHPQRFIGEGRTLHYVFKASDFCKKGYFRKTEVTVSCMQIYRLPDEDTTMEEYLLMKGIRPDFFVKTGESFYQFLFYEEKRFLSDFYYEMRNCGGFMLPSNIIVLENIRQENIVKFLNNLAEDYYKLLLPCRRVKNTLFFLLSSSEEKAYLENGWKISCSTNELVQVP